MEQWILGVLLFVRAYAGVQKEARGDPLEDWMLTELKQCYKPPPVHHGCYNSSDYGCTSYLWNYELINLELFHSDPAIIVYRGLVPKEYIRAFIADIAEGQNEAHDEPNGSRHATEITIGHMAKTGAARVFKRLSRFIPFIDFSISDPWQVLTFKKDGYFAPRHEYLKFNTTQERDELSKKHGNRFANFLISLKEAEKGGEHVFPLIQSTYKMEQGDAMIWTNMDVSGKKEGLMVHGDCPVKSGEKMTATLRIREGGQYLLMSAQRGFYDYNMLVSPNLKFLGVTPIRNW